MKLYTIREAAEALGVSVSTLRLWDKKGILVPLRTPTGKRRYTEEMIQRALGLKKLRSEPRKVVLYARVSSKAQEPDLENQVAYLKEFAAGRGLCVDEIITDVGSALNWHRKGLMKLCDLVLRGEVKTVVVAYKDRLARFGFEFLEKLFARFGCELVVVNRAEDASSAQELAEDLVSIVQHFAARLYGQRTYRARKLVKKVKEALADAADGEAEEPAAEQRKVGQAGRDR
ncbi:Resolvase domain protein [Ammonifex degensii KC4]|uniref:Resolvase domain protein n=1 Tax=Ammonifex degensii (strain DSM 10501 / KC4) TaxID=429009 RepID=C9RB12_AMMDK|nr:Resolvase domain protein [Ammonifex degensii KC4]